mmetsp:Transcript_25617/g.42128  ORF Transcript_25617/g.42128 Transcript_25617/m.42128 type:complete len:324 (-) Transcript_25617:547-1518(-)|eukprot:CAMPEP_0184332182 /NCGR_PEP_ID=MMETSP1089-20130417/1408_1 /TAXON_ID=38269 ORGANISM="Gloeochaete wittrockiana, Strain SAG46.84" /NCGR_SAMPLE_ID=MMETSP1089 /ASSEMBLY_ACC=CAM_ASM_000445 /LENGTH=323 /DNA_ID=CAMNT_0026655441 /DNA_START=40 /DNA_END=1011 /DNA_ORIENTATION=+
MAGRALLQPAILVNLLSFALSAILPSVYQDKAFYLDVKEPLVSFNSEVGSKLLLQSDYKNDFFNLSMHFVTQQNQAFCGVATLCTILNAFELPSTPHLFPNFTYYTQDNIFTNKTEKVIPSVKIAKQGLTLDEFAGFVRELEYFEVEPFHSNDTTFADFVRLSKWIFRKNGNYIAINFLRREIGEEKGGHWSPLAAYDDYTERYLVMDVSRYKYPPVWVNAQDLWNALMTVDTTSNLYRGFVVISYKPHIQNGAEIGSIPLTFSRPQGYSPGSFVLVSLGSFAIGCILTSGVAYWIAKKFGASNLPSAYAAVDNESLLRNGQL